MQISSRYYHSDLQHLIDKYKCDHCQHYKLEGKGYGHLPEHEIRSTRFAGPWTIQVRDKPYKFNALTMIDNPRPLDNGLCDPPS